MAKVYVSGMRCKGFSAGNQPDGFLDVEMDPLDEYWNVLLYPEKLPREEGVRYNLDFLGVRVRE